ncbi:alpha/beta hydrolase [Candidatus Galacturonibacter soehngenii]|nr:alpha/beta hydrolase-fold protein [Candidatus Galacturonibacter soehngenii]
MKGFRMKGTIIEKVVDDREIFIYLPPSYDTSDRLYPVIYIQDGNTFKAIFDQIIDELEKNAQNQSIDEHIIVGITPIDRLNEYTPWYAKANHEKFHDFGGQGDKYLKYLEFELSNYLEKEFKIKKGKQYKKILGHSLGGLISIYSVFQNNNYSKVVGICASQWYQGWIDFIGKEKIINDDFQILFIAGEKEGHDKTTIQKNAPKCSALSFKIFKTRLDKDKVKMVWDEFDHHENLINRYKVGFLFLMQNDKKII